MNKKKIIVAAVLFLGMTTQSAHALVWDAKNCNTFMRSGGGIIGGTIGFFGDALKTFFSGGTTLASDATSGGTLTATSLGITAGVLAGQKVSTIWCPNHLPMPTDEAFTLSEVVEGCYYEYWRFMNPIPFTSDEDFCSVSGNPFIRFSDISARDGYQINMTDMIKRIRFQLKAGLKKNAFVPDLVPVVKVFNGQLKHCLDNYHDRTSTKKSDYCRVRSNAKTDYLWAANAGKVTIPQVLEAVLALLSESEKAIELWRQENLQIAMES